MATAALVQDLKAIELPLSWIYLDPNNPRFVGQDWSYVADDEIDNGAVQDETRLRLLREFGIEKLRMNMEVNGYLPIDRVIVREFKKSKYVVLEGNRRICAAKMISRFAVDGLVVSPEVLASLELIPCLQYVGSDQNAAWIFQGLRHITRALDWSAFNKAKLLVEQMEEEELNLTEVGKRFGLTPFGAGQWVRGYYAFKQAREESDFVKEVDERAYPYFQELFSRSSSDVREWMEWDEGEYKFKNVLNFNEFVSWLYPRPVSEAGTDEDSDSELPGDWEKRPLKRGDDIRQVAFLIREDKKAFERFRREKDIEQAYSEAMARKYEREAREAYNQEDEVFRAIKDCVNALDNIPHKLLKNLSSKERLLRALDQLEKAIVELRE